MREILFFLFLVFHSKKFFGLGLERRPLLRAKHFLENIILGNLEKVGIFFFNRMSG